MTHQKADIKLQGNPSLFLEQEIRRFVLEDSRNRLFGREGSLIFEEPIVGFADGDDPLFESYKDIIGSFHLTPREVISKTKPIRQPNSVTVVCWILPISELTRISNRRQKRHPSRQWAYTRLEGEKFNDNLRSWVVHILTRLGYRAVSPVRESFFQIQELESGFTSNYSERHACYAAGLGTFSLSDGFITPRGVAIRCGSIITDLAIHPTPKQYINHTENCLFYANELCDKCAKRCPAGAITVNGHDKKLCRSYMRSNRSLIQQRYGMHGTTGCGLCQTAVPCEAQIPIRALGNKIPRHCC